MHTQLKWVLSASSLAALGGGMLTPFYAVYVVDVATGISALVGAYVVDRLGFEALFLVMFGVALVGLCLIVFALEEPPRAHAEAG